MDDFTPSRLSNSLQVQHQLDGSILRPCKGDVNYMHWNINHLTNKMHHVEQYIAIYPGILHIIAISETWLTSLNMATFRLQNYQEIHSVRHQSDGGGLSIFVHNCLCNITPRILTDIVTPDRNQFLVVEVPDVNVTIVVPYRRPVQQVEFVNRFLFEFESFCLNKPRSIILGDFNLNQLDIGYREKLNDLLEMHGCALLNDLSQGYN